MIGVIIVSHLEIASRLIQAAERILGKQEALAGLDLREDDSLQSMTGKIAAVIKDFCAQGVEGILILTDLFGSTPTNASLSQVPGCEKEVAVLTGVNLPMVISTLSYRQKLALAELAAKALQDGQKGIRDAKSILLSRLSG